MRAKLQLRLEVLLDTALAADVMETARRCYNDEAAALAEENRASKKRSAKESVRHIEPVLKELSRRNPLLAGL